jgi:hypothetical protein
MHDPRLSLYREALDLEKQRSVVVANLRSISSRLGEIFRELSESNLPRNQKNRPRSPRGELAAKILGQLEAAGDGGISVRELAGKIGANPKNLHIWFATTGKKNKHIEKIGEARYRVAPR